MKQVKNIYKCVPFWSWNDELDEAELVKQVDWMYNNGVGGFFMHARGGLTTEYLGEKWFSCVQACAKRAKELGMEAYMYDENGWPSGFVGGKLLEDIENHDRYLTFKIGAYDETALVSYNITGEKLIRVHKAERKNSYLNVYQHYATSTVDILNPEVVDQFLELTHKEYQKRDAYSLKGFFTDEPQYYRWGTPYTKMLAPYFKKEYGEDILDGLGLLFVEKDGYHRFRYKFWRAMQSLMLKNFAQKIYEWCDERGYKLTGHYIEENALGRQMWCCGGIMPFYEFEHIPGIDYLGVRITNGLAAKQVASVAAQLQKKQVLTETFGCCGWDITPRELKKIAESQYVMGINLMCQHLLPFTERGQRKRDYPAHFSHANPWVKKAFKEFNDYFSVLGELLTNSKEVVNVGVLHPIRSAYFDYKRFADDGKFGVGELDDALSELVRTLEERQIPYHFIDETILAKYGKVEGDALVVGNCKYEYLIFPKIYTMDKSTEALLREYVIAGGRLLLTDEQPTYLEGEKHEYNYLSSNVSWDDIQAAQPYSCVGTTTIRSTFRQDENGKQFIYAVNLGEPTTADFTVKGGNAFCVYDILTDEYMTIDTTVDFQEGQSYILYISNEKPKSQTQLKPLYLKDQFIVCENTGNYITLDFLQYSTDGVNFSERVHHMGAFNEMLKSRYKGKLYLKYEVEVEAVPSECVLMLEDTNVLGVSMNGVTIESCGVSNVEKALKKYDVAKLIVTGKNEIVIKIDYYQSEDVYYALFGENVTESLKNRLTYNTNIEAIYLKGDFGVYGEFRRGESENVLLGNNFRLGKAKADISNLIKDGYPFFSGDIVLKQFIEIEDPYCELVVDKRFHLLEVQVNGEKAGKLLFNNRLDLSKYLVKGRNEIVLTLTVGLRNVLGPFHTLEENPTSVGPYSFERMGSWKNGKSHLLRQDYIFNKVFK